MAHSMPKKPLSILRLETELKDLIVNKNEKVAVEYSDDGSATVFYHLKLTDGYYKGHAYTFSINIPNNYPFSPPKAVCKMKVLHPSIDALGRVCLNITREDWSVQHGLQIVLFGLSSIFYDVPTDSPLNKEAHSFLMQGPEVFTRKAEEVYKSNSIAVDR
ncbi:ubiquitin-conjugating enzyme E2 M [Nematocida minor]|uniref:ubiquitin-conjugating enzyme E2 M n=1 Tax=Nematocida minor TaxID=1912983 RepID=UPI00221E901E|nr:ubiquitin-conjugating enzyme E2 M [Nematocida minor]KAI5191689.1 ubiquitin-conjugating enzyme E2 M [Nematocida minor]